MRMRAGMGMRAGHGNETTSYHMVAGMGMGMRTGYGKGYYTLYGSHMTA